MPDELPLIAYQIADAPPVMGLRPAAIDRDWMDATAQRYAYRCLPLNIANQNGWVVTAGTGFRAFWYGGAHPTDIEVQFDGPPDPFVSSHFGHGVLTFSLPWLFRTPPGVNLWVKGPSNSPKDGIQALEGVVETDWSVSTFTMNWRFTRGNEWVRFEAGEPVCHLVPVPRGFTEGFAPRVELLTATPELHAAYKAWEASRSGFLTGLKEQDPEAIKRGWQKDYFQGKTADGGAFDGHQTRLGVKPFDPPPTAGGG